MAKTDVQVVTLGDYIERVERRNWNLKFGLKDVRGVTCQKVFIPSRANLEGRSLEKFLIVEHNEFVFNRRTNRHGDRLCIGFNTSDQPYILTEDYVCFRVRSDKAAILSSWYLYLIFLCDEFDRYVRWDSWGSATEFFNWENMCRVRIPLPSLKEQEKLVAAWKALRTMKEQNEALAEPLFALCRSRLHEMKKEYEAVAIGDYIEQSDDRNRQNNYLIDAVMGISIEKKFIETKADMTGVSLEPYKLVKPQYFGFVTVTSRNGEKISLAYNETNKTYIVSSSYEVFRVTNTEKLLPEFLFLIFQQKEFDRYARFNSWGSARETFNFDEMCRVSIPLPPLSVQKALVEVYRCAAEAKRIAEEADRLSREICPALIQYAARGGD
ncbi:restriction endonuclease subunit S [uncultured Mailhella sp.]|uniref:restriction endonuclease subunit S n=1 Tax=uncultured Mailhella sp. TaxID=1981031 RepID=UPI0025DEC50F|nr:restriction endonuclease subunit S [uncultured Mailhella sp.]